jgi:hypothetical protein
MNLSKKIFPLLIGVIVIISFLTVVNLSAYGNSNQDIPGSITKTNYVTFQANNLPSTDNFTVHINSKSYTSVGSYLHLGLSDGNYNYSIQLPYKYSSNISSGHIYLNNSNVNINFTVTYRNYDFMGLLAISIVISLIAILIAVGFYVKFEKS